MALNKEREADFSEVKRRLRPGDVFTDPSHDWKTQGDSKWVGSCPWHDSDSGTCFKVYEPSELKWKCHSCGRGGDPLNYVAELENIGGGARGSLNGQDFFRAWEALAQHAGCAGPPDTDSGSGRKSSDRKPQRNERQRPKAPRKVGTASTTSKGAPSMSRDIRPAADTGRKMKHSEEELQNALKRYWKALKSSEKARTYVEGRGLSVETLRAYGCGYAAPGEWLDDNIKNENGTLLHRAPNGRIVTPHTTPGGRLVCLFGRAVEPCPDWLRKRHLDGHESELFNTKAIKEGSGPLVLCEGPFDALSFIEAGWERTVALHGTSTSDVPWTVLRENADTLVFAFDNDEDSETGQTDAPKRAREALKRGGFNAHTLHDEDSYAGHGDPNDALQAGELSLDYLEEIGSDPAGGDGNPKQTAGSEQPQANDGKEPAAESRETAVDGSGPEADRSPTQREGSTGDGEGAPTAADLVGYWNGDDIGHLGRWLWERGGVPEGEVGAGLYADRELHKWIKEKLEAGPDRTTEQDRIRLRWVLWRLYAAHGPEEVPEEVVEHLATPGAEPDTEAEHSPETADVWEERPRDPYRLGRLPETVETTRTAAPKDNPHEGQRGIEIDSPYSEDFVHDLKVLPEWARTWNGEAWVVDDCFAAFAGDLCREYFG